MNEELDKLTAKDQLAMLKEIDKNYSSIKLPDIEPKYNENGEITNEKEIKETLKKVLAIVSALWVVNKVITDTYSSKTMSNVFSVYMSVIKSKIPSKTVLTKKEWTKIIDKAMLDRAKKIKINTVISGNAKILNRRIQNTVIQMYKNGKSKPQIAKELQRTMRFNKNKAKSIAMTEVNYYKSEAQLQALKGVKTRKTWVHNHSIEPRETHQEANGKTVIGIDNYFTVGGYKTKAPQHFGIAAQDINCHCTMVIELMEGDNE